MCRLLAVCSPRPFDLQRYLEPFAEIARISPEYQGHGWGCGWMTSDGWQLYHNIAPVWEDKSPPRGQTRILVAHARSAFRDEGIVVSNNMPFTDGDSVFLFNGELRGVKLKQAGRIGAEKIFNFIKRFDKGNMAYAIQKGVDIVERRTRYVRAMNIIIVDARSIHVTNRFNDSPNYFQMHIAEGPEQLAICSVPLPQHNSQLSRTLDWQPLPANVVHTFRT